MTLNGLQKEDRELSLEDTSSIACLKERADEILMEEIQAQMTELIVKYGGHLLCLRYNAPATASIAASTTKPGDSLSSVASGAGVISSAGVVIGVGSA